MAYSPSTQLISFPRATEKKGGGSRWDGLFRVMFSRQVLQFSQSRTAKSWRASHKATGQIGEVKRFGFVHFGWEPRGISARCQGYCRAILCKTAIVLARLINLVQCRRTYLRTHRNRGISEMDLIAGYLSSSASPAAHGAYRGR